MEIWWIAPIYVVLFFVGKSRGMNMKGLFALMEGVFLAQYSFFYLPIIFIWHLVFATLSVLLGILLGSLIESHLSAEFGGILSPILFFCCVLFFDEVSLGFVHGVLGGAGLYYATGAVLPNITYQKGDFIIAVGGIVGFLLGTLCLFYV